MHNPADKIQDIHHFGEYGGVNPSITDSSTFTYLEGKTMEEVFGGEREDAIYTLDIQTQAMHI